ncbi:nucleotidyltransferase domain-containing protein [Candidatus Micrarchaeota archaeon]|nr:nucleotidyltransferase domain-containing protein [Candidatus Micrarchaeota archaeon]
MDSRLVLLLKDIRNYFKDARIYLFGSQARGNANENSDFDLIIISEKFQKIPFVDRGGNIWRKTSAALPADLLCYTPEEFARISKTSVVLKDALKDAVLV